MGVSKSVLLLQALELLKSRQGVTMAELSAELGRSERTLYRYLAELASELSVPVYCEDGMYRLASRSASAGLFDLTHDEALAVHVALSSTAMSSAGPFGAAARSALRKVESAVKDPTFQQVEHSRPKHLFAPSVSSDGQLDGEIAVRLRDAVRLNKRLKLLYRSQRSLATEELVFDPYGMAFRRHNWYLIGRSHKHGRVIQLKMARIRAAEDAGDTFEAPADFSLQRFYEKSWEVWTGGEDVTVKVGFSPRVADRIREGAFHTSQQIEETLDGGVTLTVTVSGMEEIGSWILGFGADAEVLAPEELRRLVRRAAQGILAHYGDGVEGLARVGASTELVGVPPSLQQPNE